jgi:SAM-dependent methyltransferase
MRTQNLSRLSNSKITKHSAYYLHYSSFHKDLFAAIQNFAKGKLVDIGCGNKPYETKFEGLINSYTGCDIIQSDLNKVDVLCEANNIPLPSDSFDTVFSTQTIEHVADHQGLLNEAFRLLKPGGYCIVSAPLYWHLHEEPYDFFRFTKYGFQYLFEKAGFSVVQIQPNGGMWATTGQSIIHAFSKSQSKNFIVRVWRFLFYKLRMYWLVNSIFAWLDKVDYNPINTMNYVVVAQKK